MNLKLLSVFLSIAQATEPLDFVSTGAKFNVTLTCQKLDSNCEDIKHTFKLVTGFIENAPLLEGQINVKVEFLTSIGDTSGSRPQNLAEARSPSSSIDIERVSFVVPDAVLRQNGQKTAADSSADILMTIDSAVNFYFPSMFGSAQKKPNIAPLTSLRTSCCTAWASSRQFTSYRTLISFLLTLKSMISMKTRKNCSSVRLSLINTSTTTITRQ
ncbi:hypothetical protein DSO57_1018537 [Entomophthora muscae]|uniref:Uncharacterized protein n=1 Tax=Entomophthora muscae TaxID=34485 RepID=A0ACC2U2D7_9FUNG|nr:hypothetical protein DSO57_1018537 [Entomophthora muscae]